MTEGSEGGEGTVRLYIKKTKIYRKVNFLLRKKYSVTCRERKPMIIFQFYDSWNKKEKKTVWFNILSFENIYWNIT